MATILRLYHGTSESRMHRILREGIRPRTDSQRGNFSGINSSMAGYAYLTGYYPLFYAEIASPSWSMRNGQISRGNPKRVVIEIDAEQLDPSLMRPDEDALRQYVDSVAMLADENAFWRTSGRMLTNEDRVLMKEVIDLIPGGQDFVTDDIEAMRELWPHSYALIGSVAYKGVIPPEAIVRYAKVDIFYLQKIMLWNQNVEMNVVQHKISRDYCSALNALILDGISLPPINLSPSLTRAQVEKLQNIFWTNESDRRAAEAERQKGIRVYTPLRTVRASHLNATSPAQMED